jgi:hypothetical protein
MHISNYNKKIFSIILIIGLFSPFITLAQAGASLNVPDVKAIEPDTFTETEYEEIDTEGLFTGAARNCFTAVTATLLSDLFSGLAARLADKVIDTVDDLSKVPVIDKSVLEELERSNAKYVGTKVGIVQIPALNALGWCLGNALLEQILVATTEWVLNGYDGNPVFIDDPEQFFTDALDYEAGEALNELSGGFLCSPFSLDVRLSLLKGYTGYNNNGCRLSEVDSNFQNFVESDFEEGGWREWFELTQHPQNNPYGSYNIAFDTFYSKISARQGNLTIDLGWNNGFINKKDPFTGETVTPGQLTSELLFGRWNSSIGRITVADEFDQLIGALVNSLVKVAISEVTDVF